MEFFETVITEDAKRRVMDCLNSGYLSEGKLVKEFEQKLEEMFGYRNGVAVNSGTSALHLALVLSGVGEGDEVIIPAQTFVATGLAVLYCGAKVVFADIDVHTGNISFDSVSNKITWRTKAVICVSWGGNPCELEELQELCDAKHIYLIQDNAQALGAFYYALPISEYGDFSCFSFQSIKHITTGDGGLLTCRNEVDTKIAKAVRWFGIDRDYDVPDETGERLYNLKELGWKYHMSDYSAALGLGNLEGFMQRQNRRDDIARRYDDLLPESCIVEKIGNSANWLYTILIDDRSKFMKMMKSKNIPVSVVHVGIQRNDIFRNKDELPNQEYWDRHHVCLPIHSSLTDDDVKRVVDAVLGGWW
jgi:dTDP-4-amino-4,6-dideoxygalactose transaminase